MDYSDIDFTIGSVNPSGIGPKIYYCPKSDITSFPTPANPEDIGATLATVAKITGDFVMATGKKFKLLYSTQGKGKITAESTGEVDMKMYLNKAVIVYPKLTPETLGLAKAMANGDYVFVIQHDSKFFLIGSKDYRCAASVTVDSGDAAGSAKGVTINLECPDVTPTPIYAGELSITGGTLDCDTGVFTAAT